MPIKKKWVSWEEFQNVLQGGAWTPSAHTHEKADISDWLHATSHEKGGDDLIDTLADLTVDKLTLGSYYLDSNALVANNLVHNSSKWNGQTILLTSVTNGQILRYNSGNLRWENYDVPPPPAHAASHEKGGSDLIDTLGDLTVDKLTIGSYYLDSSGLVANNQVFNSQKWDGQTILLTGVTNGQILRYVSGDLRWENFDLIPDAHAESHEPSGSDEIDLVLNSQKWNGQTIFLESLSNGQILRYDSGDLRWENVDHNKASHDALALTELGTVDTGTWQATAIANAYVAGIDQNLLQASNVQHAKIGLGVAPTALVETYSRAADVELLRFNTDRAWSFYQRSTGASTALDLRGSVAGKYFSITNLDGEDVAKFYVGSAVGANNSVQFCEGRVAINDAGEVTLPKIIMGSYYLDDSGLVANNQVFNSSKWNGQTILLTGITNGQILRYNSGQLRWENYDFVPTAHASTHLIGGGDPLSVGVPANIGTSNAAGTATNFVRRDHVHAHPSGLGVDLHHAQSHTLASHSTKAHSELSDAPANAHHDQLHASTHEPSAGDEIDLVFNSQKWNGQTILLTSPTNGQILRYNSGDLRWENYDFVPADHASEHHVGGGDLVNHDSLTGFVAAEHISLPNTIANVLSDHNKSVHDSLGLDHGDLSGKGDDDHTQYILASGTRAFTGVVSGVTPTLAAHLATKSYVDGQVSGVNEFTELTDTPSNYTGSGGKFVKVNATPDALIFASIAWADVSKTGSNLTDLATRQHAGLTDVTDNQHHDKLHASTHEPSAADQIDLVFNSQKWNGQTIFLTSVQGGDILRYDSGDLRWENEATTSITTLGTIGTGIWQATPIANAYVAGINQDLLTTSSVVFNASTIRRYIQNPNGVPTSNLGTPTVTEMALFDTEFNNKTEFYNINNLKFYIYDAGWTEYTDPSDTNKRKFLGGDASSGIIIPNLTEKFRVEITNSGAYVYLNALYMYWSSSGSNTTVHIWRRYHATQVWSQLTSSTATVSSWPGHMYLPFPTIAFHPSSDTRYDAIRIEFTPNWSGENNISLYRLQLWGGYPAGKRRIYSIDENKKVTFPVDVATPKLTIGSYYLDSSGLVANNQVFNSQKWDGQTILLTSPSNGQILRYNSGQLRWENADFVPTAHASTHHVGGSDLVNHDSLTGFVAGEHFLQSAITTVGTIGTGVWQGTAIGWTYVSKTGSNLTDLATRQHAGLTDITANQHHDQLHASTHEPSAGDEIDLVFNSQKWNGQTILLTSIQNGQILRYDSGDLRWENADFVPTAHASEHEVGGGDLISHDDLTDFVAGEHFLQSAITTVGTIGTGVWQGTAIAWTYVSKTGSNLTDLATRQHAGLTNVTSDQHHPQLHASAHEKGGGDLIDTLGDLTVDSLIIGSYYLDSSGLVANNKVFNSQKWDGQTILLTSVTNGQILRYNSGQLRWENYDVPAAPAHASSHESGGGDQVNHDSLTGFVAAEHVSLPNTIANVLSNHNLATHNALGITTLGTVGTGIWQGTAVGWSYISKTGSNLTDLATRQHAGLTDITSDQHHPQSHTLASHSTKAHSELSDAPANAHHNQLHASTHEPSGSDEMDLVKNSQKWNGQTILLTSPSNGQILRYVSGDLRWENFDFVPTDHATEHHVGGGDLVNHDSLTGFVAGEHFLQSAITTVGTIGTGVWQGTAIGWTYISKTGSNLTDLATRQHAGLTNVTANQHHDELHASTHEPSAGDQIDLVFNSQKWNGQTILLTGITNGQILRYNSGNLRWENYDFVPDDHASEHHVGGGDLVNHDSLTGFLATEHFLQSAITTVGTIGTGVWQGSAIANSYIAGINQNLLTTSSPTHANLLISSGDGKGIKFWASDSYKIYMRQDFGTEHYTSDYNMYFTMTGGTNRGFVFLSGSTPKFQIDAAGNIWANNNAVIGGDLTVSGASTNFRNAIKAVDGSGSGVDADLLEGYHASTSAGNNTIVRRTASGYIYCNYLNCTSGATTSEPTHYFVETGNDSFLRQSTPANFVAKLAADGLMPKSGGVFTGHAYAKDHGTGTTDMLTNICYGTGNPPSAGSTTIGTIFFKYTA